VKLCFDFFTEFLYSKSKGNRFGGLGRGGSPENGRLVYNRRMPDDWKEV
jgi:hypothetical protein